MFEYGKALHQVQGNFFARDSRHLQVQQQYQSKAYIRLRLPLNLNTKSSLTDYYWSVMLNRPVHYMSSSTLWSTVHIYRMRWWWLLMMNQPVHHMSRPMGWLNWYIFIDDNWWWIDEYIVWGGLWYDQLEHIYDHTANKRWVDLFIIDTFSFSLVLQWVKTLVVFVQAWQMWTGKIKKIYTSQWWE